jgi:SAM-dependent methyltransferase
MREIRDCEVCGSTALASVLDLGRHPLCDDLVRIGDARRCAEYPIEILLCDRCWTAHQRYQVPKRDLFPHDYHYRARFTKDVLDGMEQLVTSCETRVGDLAGRRVLDIGCNDGSLLGFFKARGATTFGIEPTGAADDAEACGHRIWNEYLSVDLADRVVEEVGRPDIITFTNVFAHIEHLSEVLEALRRLMGESTLLIVENHYLGSVLDTNQFDTFYHEHPRSYSYTSFLHIARMLDRSINDVQFPSRYGGNIRVFVSAGRAAASTVDGVLDRERQFPERFAQLRENVGRWRQRRRASIDALVRRSGPLRGKAFPGRAAILLKLLELDEGAIVAVHERPGSMKIGHYVPGTRIPIVSDEELFAGPDRAKPIVNLAWHIGDEIKSYLRQHGVTGPVIDLVSAEDFTSSH